MVKNVTLTIDHKSITVPETTTILEAARMLNINIPTLCYLKDVNEIAACRLCCVEVKGMERLVPACDNVVADGMEVFTNSPMAREARRANLRLILSEHDTSCTSCSRSGNCTLQSLANDFNMRGEHYPTKLRREAVDYSTPLIRENDKCVKCMRCIQICENVQTVKIWDLLGTGSRATVDASRNRRIQDTECTYCGQCITHCPTAALRERDDTGIVFDAIDDPNTVTVVQVAPAVRAAWAEQFNLSPEFATPKRMAAALRELGFNYVFDTDFAADLTIMEEASEFIDRFTHRDRYTWPMFTSCCPGWVRFVKGQFPRFIGNLSVRDTHSVRLSKAGYQDQTISVKFNGREPLVREETMVLDSGSISISSEPAGAEVFVNGIPRGRTPVVVNDIPKGRAVVKFRLEGFHEEVRELSMRAGDMLNLPIEMRLLPGTLHLVSVPEGARFYLDDIPRGEGPLAITDLKPGEYRVRAEKDGFGVLEKMVTVEAGQSLREEFRLSNVMGRLEVRTEPPGATVVFDGRILGITKGESLRSDVFPVENVREGEHVVIVRKEGYEETSRRVTVRNSKTSQTNIRLKRIFLPDIEIETVHGIVRGVLVEESAEKVMVEVSLGITKAIMRTEIRGTKRLKVKGQ